MKRAIITLAVALILVTAGCAGDTSSAATPEPTQESETTVPETATDQMTTDSETASESTTPWPTPEMHTTEAAFQTGNQSASLSKAIDGDSFVLYYGDHHAKARVELADVTVPGMNASDNDPSAFYYHEASSDAHADMHRQSLRAIGYEAVREARGALSGPGGEKVTVVHTGETTDAGVPLVNIYFEWNGRSTLYSAYVAGSGLGVLTNPDSPHAEHISNAQEWAQNNDEGIWASNGEGEHDAE